MTCRMVFLSRIPSHLLCSSSRHVICRGRAWQEHFYLVENRAHEARRRKEAAARETQARAHAIALLCLHDMSVCEVAERVGGFSGWR